MDQNCVSEVASNGDGISCLAFQLWEEAGRPEGRYLEFWMGAEMRLLDSQRQEMETRGVNASASLLKQVPAV